MNEGHKFISLGYLVLPSLNKAFTYLLTSAFWESFESLVHTNEEMSPIDKFNYLNLCLRAKQQEQFKDYH
jgi:hypothetical protein